MVKDNAPKKPANVPHIPTTAEMVGEQIDDLVDSTLELLDERLFYVFDKYSDYDAETFSSFVKAGLEKFSERAIEKVMDWEGNPNADED